MPTTIHIPVLPAEVLRELNPQPGQIMVDGTLGGGGHTRALAERVGDTGRVIAVDRDPQAVERASEALAGLPVSVAVDNYCELPELLDQLEIPAVNGILLDLGLSSDQLADQERGFSFDSEGPLDLRFNPLEGEPAWRLIERLSPEHLADVIYHYGEERYSRRVARRLDEARQQGPLRSARQIADIIRRAIPRSPHDRIDAATRSFQALRIAVNEELKSLEIALRRLPDYLAPGGRLAIISFHSLEDRRVKEAFRTDERLELITRKPLTASEAELATNPRSRSAKLRVAQRKVR